MASAIRESNILIKTIFTPISSFEKFANKSRETFDDRSNQIRALDAQLPCYIYKINSQKFMGGATYKELEVEVNLINGSISRTINRLGDVHRKGYRGFGLVVNIPDPQGGGRI